MINIYYLDFWTDLLEWELLPHLLLSAAQTAWLRKCLESSSAVFGRAPTTTGGDFQLFRYKRTSKFVVTKTLMDTKKCSIIIKRNKKIFQKFM